MKNEKIVQITATEYRELLEESDKLNMLECAGVDNWEGYGISSDEWEGVDVDAMVEASLVKEIKVEFENAKESIYENDFRIENDVDAEKMIELMKELEQQNEKLIEVCKVRIEEYKMKIEGYEQETANMVNPIKEALLNYMQTCEVKETKTQFSYKLPSGTLKYTKDKKDYDKNDDDLLAWVKVNREELIKVKESVDWATLKKDLKIEGDSVITKDGEVVEGVSVIEKQGKFEVK